MFLLPILASLSRQALIIEKSSLSGIINVLENEIGKCDVDDVHTNVRKGLFDDKDSFHVCHSSFNDIVKQGVSVRNGGTMKITNIKEVLFNNVTFENIYVPDNGGSIYIETSSNICFKQCKFTNSWCKSDGGACFIKGSTNLNFSNNHFFGCYASSKGFPGYGGALYIESVSQVVLAYNHFENCYADNYGGAVCLYSLNNINFSMNKFIGDYTTVNSEYSFGGAVYLYLISNETTFNGDEFANCSILNFGGAFSVSDSTNLDLKLYNITFDNCSSTFKIGGAACIKTVKTVIFDGLISKGCRTMSTGGSLYFEDIKKFVILSNSSFYYCNTTDFGGSIYFSNPISTQLFNITFSNSNSNEGGALFYKSKSTIIISYVYFKNCSSNENGGAIYCFSSLKIEIGSSKFTECRTASGSGGAIFTLDTNPEITLKNNYFMSCKSYNDGASICISKSEAINFISENNIYNDSEGGTSGAVFICSTLKSVRHFFNDKYSNCRANRPGGIGGAVFLKIGIKTSYIFEKCDFLDCYSTNAGALRFNISSIDINNIKILGCNFTNCSADEAACIGIKSIGMATVTLEISDNGEVISTFQSLIEVKNNYAIISDANTITFNKCEFKHVSIGLILTNEKTEELNINTCRFNNCISDKSIISTQSLIRCKIDSSSFKECSNCFQINSTSIAISSVTFNDTVEYQSPSIFTGNSIRIFDYNLFNHKERIEINANQELTFKNGIFVNFSKVISISSASTTSTISVEGLSAYNSRMFQIANSVGSFKLLNSLGSYLLAEHSSFLTSYATNTEFTNCNFSRNHPYSIIFRGKSSIMRSFVIDGEGPNIEVSTTLSLFNSTFISKNHPLFDIKQGGKIILNFDGNCINKPFEDTFTGTVTVVDQMNDKIEKFYNRNNKCKDESPATPQFNISSLFKPSEQFSISIMFEQSEQFSDSEQMLGSNHFTESKVFSETNEFSITKQFEETNQMSHSNEFIRTNEFSSSIEFKYILKTTVQTIMDHSPAFQSMNKLKSSEQEEQKLSLTETTLIGKSNETFIDEENFLLEETKKSSTGMVAGIISGAVVIVVVAVIAIYVLVSRKMREDDSSSISNFETEFETTSIETAAYSNTAWSINQTTNGHHFMIDDFEESSDDTFAN